MPTYILGPGIKSRKALRRALQAGELVYFNHQYKQKHLRSDAIMPGTVIPVIGHNRYWYAHVKRLTEGWEVF